MSAQCHWSYSLFSPLHTTCFRWHGSDKVIICLSSYKRDIDVVLGQTWQNSVAMLSPDLLSRLTKSKNTSLIWGRHHFLDLKAFRKTLNTSWFAYLSVSSSLMIEGKAFSFWIFCGVAFDRTYAPVIRTSSCTVLEGLVAFLYQWVIKCSFKSSTELLNSIRIAWKLPLFTDAVLLLSSRWPLREMFCLPHNIMVLMIALSKFIFLSNISWFCVEILKWQGFLWFLSTLN